MAAKKRVSKPSALQVRKKRKTANDQDQSNEFTKDEYETARDTPRDKVLATTELLEAILECLPPATLFVIQRVDKHFHATIAMSPRIQQKMFLRLKNGPRAMWEPRYTMFASTQQFISISFAQVNSTIWNTDRLVTPVFLNPTMDRILNNSKSAAEAFGQGGEHIALFESDRTTLDGLGTGQSYWKAYLCDPHCTMIEVNLSFDLGVRLPWKIDTHSVVRSEVPLTIAALITTALDTPGVVDVRRSFEGLTSLRYFNRMGVPRQMISELQEQTGRNVFFSSLRTSFHLKNAVAPTDTERERATRMTPERALPDDDERSDSSVASLYSLAH